MFFGRDREFIEQDLRLGFDLTFEDKVERSLRMPLQQMGPGHYFAKPTNECFAMFVEGHFFGCISLVQSVAEGIVRFLIKKSPQILVADITNYGVCVNALQRDRSNPVISPQAFAAFRQIRGPRKDKEDRNTFHHLDEDIELDITKLEARAEQCIRALCEIEAEIFGYSIHKGQVTFNHPEYWPDKDEKGGVPVSLRL